jgi:DNA-binding CsgD family transcriptional regulator/PAS domain-containing protein
MSSRTPVITNTNNPGLRDELVSSLHAAAAGRHGWEQPLAALGRMLDLWAACIVGMDRQRETLVFGAAGWSQSPRPWAEPDDLRFFDVLQPRIAPALRLAPGQWFHCHEHLDDRFVAEDPLFQQFLIPHGGRYLSATRLGEHGRQTFLLGLMRGLGAPPLGPQDAPLLEPLRHHAAEAVHNHQHLREQFADNAMAQALFEQFPCAMLVVDEDLGVCHANTRARALLKEGEVLREEDGMLRCGTRGGEQGVSDAIRHLRLRERPAPPTGVCRRVVKLERAGQREPMRLFVSALHPDQSTRLSGVAPRALIIVHDGSGGDGGELDPMLMAECFSLTPAEARVAVKIVAGLSAKEIARAHFTSEATVRTQVNRALQKTGVTRQADLVRLLLSMPLRQPRPKAAD